MGPNIDTLVVQAEQAYLVSWVNGMGLAWICWECDGQEGGFLGRENEREGRGSEGKGREEEEQAKFSPFEAKAN